MDFKILNENFDKMTAGNLNPLVLAFVGDAVFEVYIRCFLVNNNRNLNVNNLHKKAIGYVKAHAQSDFIKALKDELSEGEMTIFKRGRNAKSGSVPKNADMQEYRNATGFEALVGYLYITEALDRLNNILEKVILDI